MCLFIEVYNVNLNICFGFNVCIDWPVLGTYHFILSSEVTWWDVTCIWNCVT
jgi:hypothetical protein